jgi:NAD+ synthase (glutamine-hydrolysing)
VKDFFNLFSHGFIRVAACIPEVKVADPLFNAEKTIELIEKASQGNVLLAVFPELGISGYTNEDLFFQKALLEGVYQGLQKILRATENLPIVVVTGAPLVVADFLYNCAVLIQDGRILGIAVKSYLPNYREFYEMRHFRPAAELACDTVDILGQRVPIGADLIFNAENIPGFRLFTEICEDVWTPVPPSGFAALSGATVIANLSASNVLTGKDEYRHSLVSNQSARCLAAYIYTAAGPGESTTDLAWDGHAIIYENGTLLAESERFSWESQVVFADIDLERLTHDRLRTQSFSYGAKKLVGNYGKFREVPFNINLPKGKIDLKREISRFPYVPADQALRDKRCYEIYNIQVQGLTKRLKSSGIKNLVIGVSGGLDSTNALIVCAKTMDVLGLPRTNIKAYTLPGFATTDKTYKNSLRLMSALGVDSREIDIKEGSLQIMKDIGHPFANGGNVYDITFENIQAGQRTSLLFRIANFENALVVGTGDLSELALGWCTYGVGDHMSHYNVNASVPKTLIQYILRWVAVKGIFGEAASSCLADILDTEISPELIPGTVNGQPAQRTEDTVGPYELQDFNLYYFTRFGYLPTKIAFMAWNAWHDKDCGTWPDVPEDKRNAYGISMIKKWMEVFIKKFFRQSQFKRTCVPNSPKIGSGGSLSPRGDYRAPSDSEDAPWLKDLEKIPDIEQ